MCIKSCSIMAFPVCSRWIWRITCPEFPSGGRRRLDSVSAQLSGDPVTAILSGEERQITAKVYNEPFYYAPLLPEQKVGEVQFYLGEQKLGTWDLYPQRMVEAKTVKKEGFWDRVSWFGQ